MRRDNKITEAEALAWWCANAGQLRHAADKGGWLPKLEDHEAAIRDGASVLVTCRKLRLTIPGSSPAGAGITRGGEVPLPADGELIKVKGLTSPDPAGRGNYRCPRGRCSRTSYRSDDGSPPVCAVFGGQPMVPGR